MTSIPVVAAFITSAATENTGGNCMADVLALKAGGVLFITDEAIGVAPGNTWHDGPTEDFRGFAYEAVGCVARADSESERSPCGLMFVERISTYEPDGPVSVDLVVLCDGRVIGIDADSIVLYPSMEAFDALGEDSRKDDAYPVIGHDGSGGVTELEDAEGGAA